jgi:hypothetical protein
MLKSAGFGPLHLRIESADQHATGHVAAHLDVVSRGIKRDAGGEADVAAFAKVTQFHCRLRHELAKQGVLERLDEVYRAARRGGRSSVRRRWIFRTLDIAPGGDAGGAAARGDRCRYVDQIGFAGARCWRRHDDDRRQLQRRPRASAEKARHRHGQRLPSAAVRIRIREAGQELGERFVCPLRVTLCWPLRHVQAGQFLGEV